MHSHSLYIRVPIVTISLLCLATMQHGEVVQGAQLFNCTLYCTGFVTIYIVPLVYVCVFYICNTHLYYAKGIIVIFVFHALIFIPCTIYNPNISHLKSTNKKKYIYNIYNKYISIINYYIFISSSSSM